MTAIQEEDDDAKLWESVWRAEVCYEREVPIVTTLAVANGNDVPQVQWRQLEEWQALYEPSKSIAGTNEVQNEKDRAVLLDKLRKTMSSKVMDILLEVIAQVLGMAEAGARSYHDAACLEQENGTGLASMSPEEILETQSSAESARKMSLTAPLISPQDSASLTKSASVSNDGQEGTLDPTMVASTLSSVLNCLDAAVLTYRFERHDPRKFQYLRRMASDQTALYIRHFVEVLDADEESTAKAEQIIELRREAWAFVDTNREAAKAVVVDLLDDRVTQAADEALDGALAATQDMLDEAGAQLDKAAAQESSSIGKGTEKIKKAVAEKGGKTKETLASKEKVVEKLGELIKKQVIRKMDGLTLSLLNAMDGLIESLSEAHEKRKAVGGVSEQELRDETFQVMEGLHTDLQKKVWANTKTAVKIITFGMSVEQLAALVNKLA